jgi:hypothetical protein
MDWTLCSALVACWLTLSKFLWFSRLGSSQICRLRGFSTGAVLSAHDPGNKWQDAKAIWHYCACSTINCESQRFVQWSRWPFRRIYTAEISKTSSHSSSASVLPFAQLKFPFILWNLIPAMAGKRYLPPMLLMVGHTRCGHILHFCQRVSVGSISICLYVGDDQPRGTMHSSSKYTTTGSRDTGPTALLQPVSQWWGDVDNSDIRFAVTPVTHLQALVVYWCHLNTSCIKRLLFCTNTLCLQYMGRYDLKTSVSYAQTLILLKPSVKVSSVTRRRIEEVVTW